MAAIEITLADDGRFNALLAKLQHVQTSAVRRALTAAGRVVQRRATQLCPRAAQTGTRRMWSKSTAANRASAKPLAETIGVVTRDYGATVVTVVGPQYPAGALGHLVEFGHEEYLYGKPTGRRVPPHPFMRPAAEETAAEQLQAIETSLRDSLEKLTA